MSGLPDFIGLTPSFSIGGIVVQAQIEEIYNDELQITEHPVEKGASITDHAFKKPVEITLRCGWSNSSLDALQGVVFDLFSGAMTGGDYVTGVYSRLLALQESRQPFDITTSKRQYRNMLIRTLGVTVDEKTANALMVTATCREVILVNTQAATLPPVTDQANPASTAETVNGGAKALVNATPAPGGAVPNSSK